MKKFFDLFSFNFKKWLNNYIKKPKKETPTGEYSGEFFLGNLWPFAIVILVLFFFGMYFILKGIGEKFTDFSFGWLSNKWFWIVPLILGLLFLVYKMFAKSDDDWFKKVKEFLLLIAILSFWFLIFFALYIWLTPSSWWGHEPKQEVVQTTEMPTYSQPVQSLPKVSGYQLPLESGIYRLQKGMPYWWYRNRTIRMDILAKEETNAILTYRRKDSDIYWKQRLSNLGFVDILESNDDKQQGEYFVISDQDVDVKIVILDR